MSYRSRLSMMVLLTAVFGFALNLRAQDSYSGGVSVDSGSAATLELTGANTYTGGTLLGKGTVISTDGSISFSDGVLSVTGNQNVSIGGATYTGSGLLTLNLGTSQAPTMGVMPPPLVLSSGNTGAYVGVVSGSFNPGWGTATLTVNNGSTQISGVTLNYGTALSSGTTLAIHPNAVPEPTAICLAVAAAALFFVLRRRAKLAAR